VHNQIPAIWATCAVAFVMRSSIRVENVKVRLHRARKKLRGILEEKCTFQMDERNVLVCEPCDRKANEEGTEHPVPMTKQGRKRRDRNG